MFSLGSMIGMHVGLFFWVRLLSGHISLLTHEASSLKVKYHTTLDQTKQYPRTSALFLNRAF